MKQCDCCSDAVLVLLMMFYMFQLYLCCGRPKVLMNTGQIRLSGHNIRLLAMPVFDCDIEKLSNLHVTHI